MIYWICQIRELYPEQTRTASVFQETQFSVDPFLIHNCTTALYVFWFQQAVTILLPCPWHFYFLSQTGPSNSCVTAAKVITRGMVWNMKSPCHRITVKGRKTVVGCLSAPSDLSSLLRKLGPVFALNELNSGQCHRTSLTWLWCTLQFLAHGNCTRWIRCIPPHTVLTTLLKFKKKCNWETYTPIR